MLTFVKYFVITLYLSKQRQKMNVVTMSRPRPISTLYRPIYYIIYEHIYTYIYMYVCMYYIYECMFVI